MLNEPSHHRKLAFHICKLRTLKHKEAAECFRNSFRQNFDLDVIIDQSSKGLLVLTDRVQPPNKPVAEISSLWRMILHHSLQQSNSSHCGVRSVLLVQGSPHLESTLFLWVVSDATQRLVARQSTQSSCFTSCHNLLSWFQRCPHDRTSPVRRLFQEPFLRGQAILTTNSRT